MSSILVSPTNPIEHGAPGTKIIRVLVVGPPTQLALFARKLILALPVVDLMRRAKREDSTSRANRSSGSAPGVGTVGAKIRASFVAVSRRYGRLSNVTPRSTQHGFDDPLRSVGQCYPCSLDGGPVG